MLAGMSFESEKWGARIDKMYPLVNCTEEKTTLRHEPDKDQLPCVCSCKNLSAAVASCKDFEFVYLDFGNGYIYKVCTAGAVDGTAIANCSWKVQDFAEFARSKEGIITGQGEVETRHNQGKKCTLTASQHPAGSGKTYRLCYRSIQDATKGGHDTILFLTKCHAQKDTAKKQFQKLLEEQKEQRGVDFSVDSGTNPKIAKFNASGRTVVFATIDSFVFNSTEDRIRGPEYFASLVETIVQHYPTKIDNRKKTIRYAGQYMQVDKHMLVIVDEATMIEERYAKALIKIMKDFNIDVTLSGDVLQSTLYEENALTYILHQPKSKLPENMEFVRDEGNEIRRFGKRLVDFRNEVMMGVADPNNIVNLLEIEPKVETPVAAEGVECTDRGADSISVNVLPNIENGQIEARADVIMDKLNNDVKNYHYLPEDIIFESPFVTHRSNEGQLMERLLEKMEKFWENKSTDATYEHHELLARRYSKNQKDRWSAVLHKSEEGGSIKLEESIDKVRLVSIHAAQGDGRKCCYVVGLSESALRVYSGDIGNRKYASLLNVSITRMEEVVRIFIEPRVDDIYRRLKNHIRDQSNCAFPYNVIMLQKWIDLKDLNHTHIPKQLYERIKREVEHGCVQETSYTGNVVDMQHHTIRMGTMHTVLCAKLACLHYKDQLTDQLITVLRKLTKLSIIKRSQKQYYEDLNLDDLNFIPVLNYDTPRQQRIDLVDSLVGRIKKVQIKIQSWLQQGIRQQAGNVAPELFRGMEPADMVVFHHIKNLMTKTARSEVSARDTYNVIKNENLSGHYEYLLWIEPKIDNIINALRGNDNWLISRKEYLGFQSCDDGREDGREDGDSTLLTSHVTLHGMLQFVNVKEGQCVIVCPCVSLDSMRLHETCAKALAQTLCCKWPDKTRKGDATKKKVYDYIGNNARVKVCFIPLVKGQTTQIVDVFDILDTHRKEVAEMVVTFVREKMEKALSDVCMLMEQFEPGAIKKHILTKSNEYFPFLLNGFEKYNRSTTPHVSTSPTARSIAAKSRFPELMGFICSEMETALDEIYQRVTGIEEEVIYT